MIMLGKTFEFVYVSFFSLEIMFGNGPNVK